jgi:hypothetical protein
MIFICSPGNLQAFDITFIAGFSFVYFTVGFILLIRCIRDSIRGLKHPSDLIENNHDD